MMKMAETMNTQSTVKLAIGADGILRLFKDNKAGVSVKVSQCFPWSLPNRFISIRDEKDNELALINRLEDLDPESKAALESVLAETCFVFEITRIDQLEEDFEIRVWKAMTAKGPRRFQTRLGDFPRHLPDGSLLIRDVGGDLFHIPNPKTLNETSRKLLWSFLD
jgi:hypothetical protein